MYLLTKDIDEKLNNNQNKTSNKSKPVRDEVCRFYLKGNCKNKDNCPFLHENNPDKYPECPHGLNCKGRGIDCPFKHTKKLPKECHAYSNGYCPNGKFCKDLHNEQNICLNYLLGFCPDGPNCKLFHLRSMITAGQDNMDYLARSTPQNDKTQINK